MQKTLVINFVFFLLAGIANAQDVPTSVMPTKHRALMSKYCFECHNSENEEGGINLKDLALDLGTIETAETWQKVLGVLNSGEMPPEDEPQLNADEKTGFLADLSNRIVVARKILSDSGGVITMRRLNRREYANTIRTLLGVEVNVEALPDDSNSGGFDTSGASLFLSSDQFEKYLEIGREALDQALTDSKKPADINIHRECEVVNNRKTANRRDKLLKQYEKAQAWRKTKGKKKPTEFGFIDADRVKFEELQYRTRFPLLEHYLTGIPETKTGVAFITAFNGALLDTTTIPNHAPPGKYILRFRVGHFPDAPSTKRFIEIGLAAKTGTPGGELSVLGCRKVTGTIENPSIIEVPIQVGPNARKFVLRQRQPNNRDAQRNEFQKARAKKKPGPDPALWLDWVEVEGPILEQWPPAPQQKILFNGATAKNDDNYARQVINRFARRAFRNKAPSKKYIDKLVSLYSDRRAEGLSFVESIKDPLSAILASPSFLYLAEPTDERKSKRELSDMELAVRLSYFLWSAPPDYKLIQLAKSGELKKSNVLAKQTNRMLANPKAMEFVSGFSHQWLGMERLDFFQFNSKLYREFDDSVKMAARNEVYHTIKTLIRQNQPIGKLIKSDFVVINDLMADYYGIKNVKGDHYRTVKLPSSSNRGGLLGTAAILAMGSDGERTSPVERGAWVMRKILNDPPPPAPANVPQLERLEDKHVSARTLQKLHMEEPQCAQCHRKIDPIGYGLENFDAAGRWRTKEVVYEARRSAMLKRASFEIDARGTLPDGASFESFTELRDKLKQREPDFARGYSEALIGYGLGRPYGFSDHELANEIMEKAKTKKYGMREFIHALIQSKQFRTK